MKKTPPNRTNTKSKPTISTQNKKRQSGHQESETQYKPEGSLKPFNRGPPLVVISLVFHGANKTARGKKAQEQKLIEMYKFKSVQCTNLQNVNPQFGK
jgi:hypothetical protein